MLTNYMRIALRNLLRQKSYSLINIVGLAVGIACCLVIMLYVQDELSYDRFNANAAHVYRPTLVGKINGHDIVSASSPADMGPTLLKELPEVIAYTRMRNFGTAILSCGDKAFSEDRFLEVDSSFFEVFTVHFLAGSPKTALTQPNTVVLTASMAKKYFDSTNPIGKTLTLNKTLDWTVTGVVEDWPRNSHFKFDFLGSLSTFGDSRNPTWLSNNYYTYLLLQKGVNLANFHRNLDDEVTKYASPQLKSSAGMTFEQFRAAGNSYGYALQPLTSIHLYSHLDYELEPNSDSAYVYIFSAIALAILFIACVNFINLATARSEKRAREVGIRKTLGSDRFRLISQFLAESILLSGIAVILAVVFVELALPYVNQLAGKKMSLSLTGGFLPALQLLLFAAAVGIMAGSYPAFYLSSFNPVEVLAKDDRGRGGKSLLRSGLVVFQFAVSIILLVGTLVIYAQLRYMQAKDLGFDKEQLIVIDRVNDLSGGVKAFEDELRSNASIVSVTNSTAVPGRQRGDGAYGLVGMAGNQLEDLREMYCDYDFAETYRLPMLEGRFFSREHLSDTAAVVVNAAVEKIFRATNISGRYLTSPGPTLKEAKQFQIIGVTKEFNFQSLHDPVRPLALHFLTGNNFVGYFLTVRVKPGNIDGTLSFLSAAWKKYAGNEDFSWNFLDQNLTRLYAAEQRTSTIAAMFSGLAIFVACIGLLGLAAFVTERRTKEIGIRKVLGASVSEILRLLSTQFAKWVLIANVIAWPVAYYMMDRWLQDFANRVNIGLWVFVVSGASALIVSFLAVGVYAIRAATANPVESLRYE